MSLDFQPAGGALAELKLLRISTVGAVGHVRLNRPDKRNAVNDALVLQLRSALEGMPAEVKAVVLSGEGAHFCAGLDLSELSERSVADGVQHSRQWHAVMDSIQFGRVPVVAVLHGAVVGGGLEIASSCHIRVAEASASRAEEISRMCMARHRDATGTPARAQRWPLRGFAGHLGAAHALHRQGS